MRKTFVSRVVDCTGRALRNLSCPCDFEALKALSPCHAVRKLSCRSQLSALSALDPCVTLCVMGLVSAHQDDVLRQRRVRVDVAARPSRVTADSTVAFPLATCRHCFSSGQMSLCEMP